MKLKQWIKIALISTTMVTLVACSSHKKHDQYAANDSNAAYNSDSAQASGLGDESSFGDQANGGAHIASKRVYYFDFDSNHIHDDDKPAIAANAHYLSSHPDKKILLEGHTDPRGSREYNIGLGERRSKAVAEIMTEKGANPDQIRIVSYGAEKLASNGRTESDYQQDRRAVIVNSQK